MTRTAGVHGRASKRRTKNTAAVSTITISTRKTWRRMPAQPLRRRESTRGVICGGAHRAHGSTQFACQPSADQLFRNGRFALPRPKAWLHDGGPPRTTISGRQKQNSINRNVTCNPDRAPWLSILRSLISLSVSSCCWRWDRLSVSYPGCLMLAVAS